MIKTRRTKALRDPLSIKQRRPEGPSVPHGTEVPTPTDKFPIRRCISLLGRETRSHGHWNRPRAKTVGTYTARRKTTDLTVRCSRVRGFDTDPAIVVPTFGVPVRVRSADRFAYVVTGRSPWLLTVQFAVSTPCPAIVVPTFGVPVRVRSADRFAYIGTRRSPSSRRRSQVLAIEWNSEAVSGFDKT